LIAALGNYVIVDKRWLRATLPEVHRDADRRTLERFATWHLRRRLQTFADRGPVTGNQTQQAREEARQAIAFLAWLRDRDRDLSSCGQADIDAWYAGAYIARRRTHAFLRWAMSNKLLRSVTIPHQDTLSAGAPRPRHRRRAHRGLGWILVTIAGSAGRWSSSSLRGARTPRYLLDQPWWGRMPLTTA